ncbi:DNA polymerase III subunit gamma and tau [Compostimonas suwonensis]|uniref:DNA polymerase III subunit gamma and tau n=1 Tax=Compostimonas suwonensis TaxID=1048394 RepID=UPI000C251359|nr:DNA polymerase III subunit gamma and tau [Compostimonas suwonensis]
MVTALYRRYRPETFAEMIGQTQVTDPLMTALRTNRVNHAYLFSGPRGCGKTTSARILARCLNCAEGPTDTPCGVCASCVELSRDGGGSLDVVEIDAASHNGVDDARDIRERAVFAPARDRYKIFILDEAHMVTPQGFNALLKIVEEPPEHVKFIFATTEPEKVIGTIRSRTHHYPFRLIPPAQMLDYVQSLCEAEGVQVAPGVLSLVVRAGGGSPRDTLSLLDQLMAGSEDNSVGYERAVALLGYTHSALLDEVIDAIASNEAASAFEAVDRVIQTGQDPRRFVEDLLERLRDLIIVAATSADAAAAVLRGVPQDELDRMGVQAAKFGTAELSRCADIVNAALTEMTGATSPRLHLELMIARTLVPSSDDTERGALARVERLERRIGVGDGAPRGEHRTDAAPAARDAAPVRAADPAPASSPVAPAPAAAPGTADRAPVTAPPAAEAAPPAPVGPVTVHQVKDSWPQILDAVEKAKRSAWMVVFTAQVISLNDDVLTLSFPSENDAASFKQRQPSGQGVSEYLRQAILDVLGIRVKFIARVDVASGRSSSGSGDPAAPAAGPAPEEPAPAGESAPDAPDAPNDTAPAVSTPAATVIAEHPVPAPAATVVPAAPAAAPGAVTWATVAIPGSGSASSSNDTAPAGSGPAAVTTAARPAPAAGDAVTAVPTPSDGPAPVGSGPAGSAWAASAPTGSAPAGSPSSPSDDDFGGIPSDDEAPPETEPPFDPGLPTGWYVDDSASLDPAPSELHAVAPSAAPAAPTSAAASAAPSAPAAPARAPQPPARTPVAASAALPDGRQRYGESVVREILGATFLEEQPHRPASRFE